MNVQVHFLMLMLVLLTPTHTRKLTLDFSACGCYHHRRLLLSDCKIVPRSNILKNRLTACNNDASFILWSRVFTFGPMIYNGCSWSQRSRSDMFKIFLRLVTRISLSFVDGSDHQYDIGVIGKIYWRPVLWLTALTPLTLFGQWCSYLAQQLPMVCW